jgi:hypothetical protein
MTAVPLFRGTSVKQEDLEITPTIQWRAGTARPTFLNVVPFGTDK